MSRVPYMHAQISELESFMKVCGPKMKSLKKPINPVRFEDVRTASLLCQQPQQFHSYDQGYYYIVKFFS